MTPSTLDVPVSLLRRRLIDDMTMRRFSRETQRNYIRDVGRFATFLGGPPDRATADDLRRFQDRPPKGPDRYALPQSLAGTPFRSWWWVPIGRRSAPNRYAPSRAKGRRSQALRRI